MWQILCICVCHLSTLLSCNTFAVLSMSLLSCDTCGQPMWEHAEGETETNCEELIFLVCFCTSLGISENKIMWKLACKVPSVRILLAVPKFGETGVWQWGLSMKGEGDRGESCKKLMLWFVILWFHFSCECWEFVCIWPLQYVCVHNTFQYCSFKSPLHYTCVCVCLCKILCPPPKPFEQPLI